MAGENSLLERLHTATHRVPGVPAHVERPAGHQGRALARHPERRTAAQGRPRNAKRAHAHVRPPRVLVAWQRRIAAFFGQEPR
jgi:hypothetical protein